MGVSLRERKLSEDLSSLRYIIFNNKYLLFWNFRYEDAEKHFLSALEKIQSSNHDAFADKWEPLLNNLGHVSRKLKWDNYSGYHLNNIQLICSPTLTRAMDYFSMRQRIALQ